jgi:hypothetical protein
MIGINVIQADPDLFSYTAFMYWFCCLNISTLRMEQRKQIFCVINPMLEWFVAGYLVSFSECLNQSKQHTRNILRKKAEIHVLEPLKHAISTTNSAF